MIIKKSFGETLFDIFNYFGMALICLIVVFPFWSQLVTSISGGYEAYESPLMFFPKSISFNAYVVLFQFPTIWVGYMNSIIRTIIGTILSTFFTALTAYPLSKKNLPFCNAVTMMLLFTMLFSAPLIPRYLLVKNLGMLNSMPALVIPNMIAAWNVFIVRNFFRSIPESLEESAIMDGAGRMRVFLQIVLPLSVPVIATIALWSAVDNWNEWFSAMLYIHEMKKQVLQIVFREFVLLNRQTNVTSIITEMNNQGRFTSSKQIESTAIMMSVLPMIIIYPFIQKHFVKGIMVGSIKG